MKRASTIGVAALTLAMCAIAAPPALAQSDQNPLQIPPEKIDETVAHALKAFDVPGMAVAIVKDSQLIFAKGYGLRESGRPEKVDTNTIFQIGSNTKAFTAAALAILVDEGKIHWDDKVIDYLPQFQLYDPYVTREFTIRDLLTHRSGLETGSGDLMFYPTTDFTRAEIIGGLRYLAPVSSFRSQYAYSNVMYMVAGQIIPAVTGQSWEAFVETRILKPLDMKRCAATHDRLDDQGNFATPHTFTNGKVAPITLENIDVIGAAGSINCSINGMANWLKVQLAAGKMPNGKELFSPDRSAEMWTMNTVVPVDPAIASFTDTNFKGYGLGWFVEDEFGYKRVSHTGGVLGGSTFAVMIPELQLGILVFANQQNPYAMEAVGNQILDAYVGAPQRDLVTLLSAFQQRRESTGKTVEAEVSRTVSAAGPPTLPLGEYTGTYKDPWRGLATIGVNEGRLVLTISRTKGLKGVLSPYSGNIFIVRWDDRRLNADAFVVFDQTVDKKVSEMKLQPISPDTDTSFDFQDLQFTRID